MIVLCTRVGAWAWQDGNGVISQDEFVTALKKDPLLLQCFSRSMLSGVPMHQAKASWEQLEQSGAKKFDLSLLRVCAVPHTCCC